MSGLESAFINPVNGTSFEGLKQVSRVATYIYDTTPTLCPNWSQHLISR